MVDVDAPSSPDERIFISNLMQKAFVEVNEKGTEAAAVTAMTYARTTSIPPTPLPPVVMDIDRPFIFAILDSSSYNTLFMGRITDPSVAR